MARKKKPIEPENHERWLVSYADFITLLFAFFVVMYSMSSVNEGKYRVLSDSVSSAFMSAPRSNKPIQVGELTRSPKLIVPTVLESTQPIDLVPIIISNRNKPPIQNDIKLQAASQQIENIAVDIGESLQALIDDEEIELNQNPLWLEVKINSSLLFTSASAQLSSSAADVLNTLGALLNSYPNRINVEGFTDNRPIQNSIFPSNWELSSARAAAVVRLFENFGIDPTRMVSVGYGEFRPSGDNATAEGRASNRKVVVVIMADIQNDSSASPFTDLELVRQQLEN